MALQGTLKDFGIADILQLIGQQQKTGTLHLKSKDQDVQVGFKDGSIVKAESSTRKKKDLLGNMLVRAQVITESQLEQALEDQRRMLRRLGDVLVASGVITKERFREMVHLQTTETLSKLFTWKSGTYAFEQGDVEFDPETTTPLRAESVLMEGFRMVDEWPVIKRKIARYDLTFARVKPLPPPVRSAKPSPSADEDDFGDPFAEEKKADKKGDFASVGEAERRVYGFATPERDVRALIDLACMGEFETCKALCSLVNLEYLRPVVPASAAGEALLDSGSAWERVRGVLGRVVVTAGVLTVVIFVVARANFETLSLAGGNQGTFVEPAAQKLISKAQLSRIEAAVDVYRLEKGEVPEALGLLVSAGLLGDDDLRYPWKDGYFYRRLTPQEFILLPPLR